MTSTVERGMTRTIMLFIGLLAASATLAQTVTRIPCSPTTGLERFAPRDQRCQPSPPRPWRWSQPPPPARQPPPLELRSGRLNHRHYLPPPYDPMIDPAPGLENQWRP